MTTLGWRRPIGLLAAVLVAGLALAACSDDDTAEGPDDSTPSSETTSGEAIGPTVAPDDTVATSVPEIPDPLPIPEAGLASLEFDGEPIEVELGNCEYDPRPEIGLDVTMRPPTATESNRAGLVLIVPQAQAGRNVLTEGTVALQLEGDLAPAFVQAVLELSEDLLSGTMIFQAPRDGAALIGRAAFHCI
jgi:hypothetical protein